MSSDQQREAFDESAPIYQAARPAYPTELFDDLIAITEITPAKITPAKITPKGSELLELGAGPGKATVDLARRGFKITVLELGPSLADHARRNLAEFPEVAVITTGFEAWDPPPGMTYDLVYAANAWQWLDPETRWSKTAGLLAAGGHLAIFGASHAFPEGFDPFFTEIQAVYDELGDGAGKWPPLPPRQTNGWLIDEAVASGHFRRVAQRMYVWPVRYDADRYLALLDTFANHIVMEPVKRERLRGEVRRLLARRPDGQLTRHWISQVAVVQRI